MKRPQGDTVFVAAILTAVAVAFAVVGGVKIWPPAPPATAPAPAPGVPVVPDPQRRPPPASSMPPTLATVAFRPEDCASVPAGLVAAIMGAALDPTTEAGRASMWRIPNSGVWLVAIELPSGIGVWATNDPQGSGLLYAVDVAAQQATGWPPAELTQLDLGGDDPMVAATRRCLA